MHIMTFMHQRESIRGISQWQLAAIQIATLAQRTLQTLKYEG